MSGRRTVARSWAVLVIAVLLSLLAEVGLIVFNDTWRTVLQPTSSRTRLSAAVAAAKPHGASSNGLRGALAAAVALIDRLGAASTSRLLVLTDGEHMRQPRLAVAIPVDAITWHYDGDDFVNVVHRVVAASGGHVTAPGKSGGLVKFIPPKPHPTSRPAPVRRLHWQLSRTLIDVLAVVFVAVLALVLLFLRSLRRGDRRPQLASQIERYGPMGASSGPSHAPERAGTVALAAVGLMTQVLRSRNTEPKLALRLDRAGIARAPAEWALLGVCVSAGLAAVFTVLLGSAVLGLLVGIVTGWLAMRLTLSVKISKRRAAFDEQLPNVLLALDGVADRLDSGDLRWVIMAVRIQRETGGNLAEVLRNTVATMRERAFLRRQMRTLSAEGRLSAYILFALPIVVGGWLFYSNPSYMRPLYTTVIGVCMLVTAAVLFVVGAIWMRNLINIKA